ncbi:MAG TPA: discoidin domain-containing protein, partial [Opitutaceae bacterium]
AYINQFKPGGQILQTVRAGDLQPNDIAEDQVFALAYKHVGQNKFVIQVLNQSTADRVVNFHGVPANSPLTLIRTNAAGDFRKTIGTYTPNGTDFSITLTAQSFNTFVGTLGGPAPTVHLTSPTNGATYAHGATIPLSATATSPNGINHVEFYDGTTLIGSSATSPYSYSWTNAADGNHFISAEAFDNASPQNEGFSDNSASILVGTAPTNLALNHPATASSTESNSYPASNAFDGDMTTRWSSAYSDNQYIQVDLGGNYNINEVKLSWEAAYASHFQIQTSVDGSSWTTVQDVIGNTSTSNDYTGLGATGRYVRINCLTRATQWGFSLYEVSVFGTASSATNYTIAASAGANGAISPSGSVSVLQGSSQTFTITPNSGYVISAVLVDGVSVGAVSTYTFSNVQAGHNITASFTAAGSGPNIAYMRPVWTSSVQAAGYEGSKAVDANGNTRWSSAYADNQTIYVDLGANYNVNRVRLAWESAYAKNYQIQFSTDATNWTTVREFWGKTSSAADDQTGLTGTARYVKVYCINRATQYGFSLWEFEVYGPKS